jgi:Flp pilus assembly protein TadD
MSLWTGLVLTVALQAPPSHDVLDAGHEMATLLHDTLKKLARKNNEDGLKQYRAGNHPAALDLFKQAFDLDPEEPEITNNLAITYFLLGNHAQAEEYYRLTLKLSPERAVAHVNLADLLANGQGTARQEEAAALLMRARELKGNDSDIMLRQARVAVRLNQLEEAERFYTEVVALGRLTPEVMMELGDFYRTAGRDEDALQWYRTVKGDTEVLRRAEERVRQVEVERQARRYGWSRPSATVPQQARNLAARSHTLVKQNRRAEAEDALKQALRVAPQFTDARMDLADLYRMEARTEAAELELLRALAFDQSNAEVHARLGMLYLKEGEASRASEAAVLLSRALQLRPDKNEWTLVLARAERLSGDLPGALQHVHAFLAGDAPEDQREEAAQLKLTLQKLLNAPAEPVSPSTASPAADRETQQRLGRARAYLARGETDAALAELTRVHGSQREAEVRTLEGRILAAAGRWPEAGQAFRASLTVNEEQPDVNEQLGVVFMRQGRLGEARRFLTRAETLGSVDAMFHLARVEVDAARSLLRRDPSRYRQQWEARQRLDRFLATESGSSYTDEARRLKENIDAELALVVMPPGTLLALAGLLMLLWLQRRVGGTDLKGLIARHPETGPEVQRLLASIRHEVLKHNTMVLSGLVTAIEHGDDVSAHAAHLQETLLGKPGVPAVVDRLRGYETELMQLGRAHGERLNLRHKDAALSALYQGFEVLQHCRGALGRVNSLTPRQRRMLQAELRTAADLLNARAYEGVRALLDGLRVLKVDGAMLQAIFARTCREPALQNVKVEPLQLDVTVDLPVGIAMPQAALQDILINLMRNAIQASIKAGLRPVTIGLGIHLTVDPVTGVERVLFLVRDRSPRVLELDTLLRQRITGGLGITAELVSRYEGSLDVWGPHEGWQKAVVVKLPREELQGGSASIPPTLVEVPHA